MPRKFERYGYIGNSVLNNVREVLPPNPRTGHIETMPVCACTTQEDAYLIATLLTKYYEDQHYAKS